MNREKGTGTLVNEKGCCCCALGVCICLCLSGGHYVLPNLSTTQLFLSFLVSLVRFTYFTLRKKEDEKLIRLHCTGERERNTNEWHFASCYPLLFVFDLSLFFLHFHESKIDVICRLFVVFVSNTFLHSLTKHTIRFTLVFRFIFWMELPFRIHFSTLIFLK